MSIRPLAIVLVSALGLAGGAASSGSRTVPPTIRTPATFFISGHGWGHGLGMSQYGAYGYALHGWTYDRIVKHYYTGTTIGQAPVSRVRVLLADKAKRVTISSKLPFQVVDGAGAKHTLSAGSYAVGAAFKYTDPTALQAKPVGLTYPLEFKPGATAVALNGRGYRGSFRILKLSGGSIRAVNVVGLDLYLRGVVPSEMPKTWPAEALKAQAVAARSYALSHLHAGGGFDLYPDTRDQVYLGIPHEAPATNAAVGATAGKVAFYKGKVASTYFFSTSGGRTASVQDLYPDSPAIPYLVSVPDPYDSISPYHDWGPYRFTARKLGRGLKSPGKLLDVETVAAAPSGRVQSVVAVGSRGQATATGSEVRAALGLRSTWFQVGVLALGAPATPLTYGTTAALSGTARGVSSVELQELVSGSWKTLSKLTPRGGAVTPRVKPNQSRRFRLLAGTIGSDSVAVAVAPSVRLHVPPELSGFWGAVRPAVAGATVIVQRQAGSAWRPVVRIRTTAQGRFTVPRSVTPGTYRARVSAKGFAPGTSKPVTV